MERFRDSVRASCSSSFSPASTTTGLSFKRRPTCQPTNEEEQDWHTSPLPDRAARKEIERLRLRKLLNQGKKKRRRLNADKLTITSHTNGVDDFHVPRKSRSVGYRRKAKCWRSIGLLAELQLPSAAIDKASPSSVQNEIEFEIAEVLSGLKQQVSSSDDSLLDDLEKVRVENEESQSVSVRTCSVDQVSKCVEAFKSNLTTTSQVIPTPMEATESKQADKFIIDLNEPPPMESSLEGEGTERLTPDPKVVFNEEVKSVSEEASMRRFVLPYKMEIKGELQDLNVRSPEDTMSQKAYSYASIGSDSLCPTRIISQNPPLGSSVCGNSTKDEAQDFAFHSNNTKQGNNSRPASTLKITHAHASQQIPKPLQAGRIKVGPLIFPLSQNQRVMASHQSGLSKTAFSTANVRFSHPIGAPFLSVLPGTVCTPNPSYDDCKRLHSSGRRNAQPVPFLDEQLHPRSILLPIPLQHQKQATSSVADIIRSNSHSNVTPQSLYPHSNVTSMPFSFASSTQSPFHLSQNPEVVPSFLDKTNLGLQILPADHGLQDRNSEQNALSGRIQQSSSNSLGASVQLKNQQQVQAMATSQLKRVSAVNNQHQPPNAAKVSNDYSIFSGNLHDRSPTLHNPSQQKLTIQK